MREKPEHVVVELLPLGLHLVEVEVEERLLQPIEDLHLDDRVIARDVDVHHVLIVLLEVL